LGVEVGPSLEALHEFLVTRGWSATPEMLAALARRNTWIGVHFGDQIE
jgi:hypothetical protein